MIIETNSEAETLALGQKIGEKASANEVIALDGELGAGKTVIAKGIAKGLGITEPVCSPTFTILQIYDEGRLPLYHFDVYRIADAAEMEEIGYEDFFYGEGVCLIEWASLISELLPPGTICVAIEKNSARGYDYRKIDISVSEKM